MFMRFLIDIPEELAKKQWYTDKEIWAVIKTVWNGTPLEQIRAEINGIEINGQIDEHTMFIRSAEQVKQMALDVIDKYRGIKNEV